SALTRQRKLPCTVKKSTSASRRKRTRNQATNFSKFFQTWGFASGAKLYIMRPVLRRGGRVAEGAPLLREYISKGCRGFESPPLYHCGLIAQLERVLGDEQSGRRFESS